MRRWENVKERPAINPIDCVDNQNSLWLFVSRAGFGGLRKHFRKFLFVSDERGESVYFRFYDPSVLRTFLPVCDSSETQSFFGPIDCFLTESENCSEVIVFEVNNGAVERRIEPLGRP